jgi:hypothetical protein
MGPEEEEPMPVPSAAIVIVSYDVDADTQEWVVTVTPSVVQVTPGQAIHFRRGGNMPGTLRLTFKDKAYFDSDAAHFASTGAILESDGGVRVKALPGRTTYLCELVDANGRTIAQSPEDGGGAVEPVTG